MSNEIDKINKAKDLLESGDVVAIPTETVYGLAASIENKEGIHKIFETKERPFFDPLIVHVASIKQAQNYTSSWSPITEALAKAFWPGPLTLIVPKNDKVSDLITSGHQTVGLRMPDHKVALELITKLGHPVAAPSANKFKKTSPTSAQHVQEEFPKLLVLEGGECKVGIESTIIGIHANEVQIYRPGMITEKKIREVLSSISSKISIIQTESPVAPGQLKHHYMPKLPIILKASFKIDKELEKAPQSLVNNAILWEIDSPPEIIARSLYSKLRSIDSKEFQAILIDLPNHIQADERWNGILNRVTKAASYIV